MVYTFRVELEKDGAGGLGLGIKGGRGEGDGRFFVSHLLAGKPASIQGSLQPNDVIIAVNGHPLEGLTLEQGCALIVASPALVRFEVQRDGDPPTVELTTIKTIPSRDTVHTDQ